MSAVVEFKRRTLNEIVAALCSEYGGTAEALFTSITASCALRLDQEVDYNVYIAGGAAYTEEMLFERHALREFNVHPADMFVQQVVYEVERLDGRSRNNRLHLLCDRGTAPVIPYPHVSKLLIETKLYVGREAWDDFLSLQKTTRALVRFGMPKLALLGYKTEAPQAQLPATSSREEAMHAVETGQAVDSSKSQLTHDCELCHELMMGRMCVPFCTHKTDKMDKMDKTDKTDKTDNPTNTTLGLIKMLMVRIDELEYRLAKLESDEQ
jgi:hypothetical protein